MNTSYFSSKKFGFAEILELWFDGAFCNMKFPNGCVLLSKMKLGYTFGCSSRIKFAYFLVKCEESPI